MTHLPADWRTLAQGSVAVVLFFIFACAADTQGADTDAGGTTNHEMDGGESGIGGDGDGDGNDAGVTMRAAPSCRPNVGSARTSLRHTA